MPLILILFFVALAAYFLFSPGPWRVSYPVRLLVGGVLLVYAVVRGLFWYRRWQKRQMRGITK
ncbi:MAG: hypothetical protein L0196_10435 [candidate division Zixibacteria bacterium]|nr:hypothetical protein [candidate division Zixibacteria bacterium]